MAVTKPLRPCNKIGCRNITSQTYCEEHSYIPEERKKERDKHYNRYKRDQETQKFYDGRAWRRTREQIMMRDNGMCQHCLKENKIIHADVVHHIKYFKDYPELALDIKNLISLCHACHNKIHSKD